MSNSSPQSQKKVCRRCNKKVTDDIICASCKNELLSMYDSKIGWKTAYEIEKVSRYVTRNAAIENTDDSL